MVVPQGALGPAEWTSTPLPLCSHYDAVGHSSGLMNTSGPLDYLSTSMLNSSDAEKFRAFCLMRLETLLFL